MQFAPRTNNPPGNNDAMRYAIMLTLLGLAQIVLAFEIGVETWLLWWSGLSWIIAGCAYWFNCAGIFGKKANGSMAWWNVLLLLPYLVATWLLWHLQKTLTGEPCCSQIVPGLWLGRRCFAGELPADIGMVVDLTSEFTEPKQVREGRVYKCVPALDASVPTLKGFQSLISAIADFEGPVYIHCALGHGRSATVVIAVLIAKGNALSLDQAEQMVKLARPRIALTTDQQHLLQQWVSSPQTD